MKRCLVCNAESFHLDFCSQECQNQHSQLMEEIADQYIDDEFNYFEDLTEEEECELLSDYTKQEDE